MWFLVLVTQTPSPLRLGVVLCFFSNDDNHGHTMSPSFEFPAPVLAVAADAVRELQGREALSSLWTRESLLSFNISVRQFVPSDLFISLLVFTKCKESLQDGRRLENISWRLWYREMATAASASRNGEKSPWSEPGHYDHIINEKDEVEMRRDEAVGGEERPKSPLTIYCPPSPKSHLMPTPHRIPG